VAKLESAFGSITQHARLRHEVFWYQGAASDEEERA